MTGEVPITLAVEDELSEHMLRTILVQTKREFLVGTVYGRKGADYLRQTFRAFNMASKGSPYLVLTDLDTHSCVPELIEKWFACHLNENPRRRHPNLVFRVAVREVESWVMADRERFADFLGISRKLIPEQTDTVPDPKELLLQLASKSRNRRLRDDIVPRPGDKRKIGPDYNGRLGEFIHSSWRANVAYAHSASLARAWKILIAFHPIYKAA
ncbi:MAG: hypothetical protein ACYDH9_17390 [Limisphaerales bacterium]